MNIQGTPHRTVWFHDPVVRIIDQRLLPWHFQILDLPTTSHVAHAILDMAVRGAGCIGATAAYGMALAAREAASSPDPTAALIAKADELNCRPTAVNLAWALKRQLDLLLPLPPSSWPENALTEANRIADEDAAACAAIGQHGLPLIQDIASRKPSGQAVNILTHCNAGWLAFVDHGSATAPIYAAHAAGIPVHVWADETRPRNQGARLTAWELAHQNIPHTVIADNTGGHLMQHGLVDLVITGADRVTRSGDVANKIGTYLKALAARDNHLPFYVALPTSTFDWTLTDGLAQIPIEARSSDELIWMDGPDASGTLHRIRLIPETSPTANHAFDVTPSRLITGLITEHGLIPANEKAIATLQQHTA
jgi:methylthioribose-1-phosphate isomerase